MDGLAVCIHTKSGREYLESKTLRIVNESSQGRLRRHIDSSVICTTVSEYICVRHDERLVAGELVPKDWSQAELEDVVRNWLL